jgi:MFS family permease
LARNFHELLLASVAIALGEAAIGPVFYSMVPDLFPGRSRITANLVYFGAVVIGTGFGVALSGAAIAAVDAHRSALPAGLTHMSAWRLAFLIVAAPGALIAPAVALIGRVPRELTAEGKAASHDLMSYFREHWRAVGGVFLATGLYSLSLYAFLTWAPVIVIRVFGAPASSVGYHLGAAFGIGSAAGVVAAGVGAKLLQGRFGVLTPLRIFQASLVMMLAPLLLLLIIDRPWEAYVLFGVMIGLAMMGTALTPTMLQDIAPDGMRGRVIAANTFCYSLIASLAPILVGAASDAFHGALQGLVWALVLVSAPCLAAAMLVLARVEPAFTRTVAAFSPT